MCRQDQGWFKSSFSSDSPPTCVEVRFEGERVWVRNAAAPQGPVLVFERGEWEAFELGVFHGEFTMPLE
ncbi:DUF397 domain-containing protein [Actinospica robiniae]|uniref:DUF397 domain-containing protein n=1 Tax=Actinospica robiniae TaxID=304901 RepID=UPI0004202AA2|nr:DUF397 domain-containing protein [Actinospica robiniae]